MEEGDPGPRFGVGPVERESNRADARFAHQVCVGLRRLLLDDDAVKGGPGGGRPGEDETGEQRGHEDGRAPESPTHRPVTRYSFVAWS